MHRLVIDGVDLSAMCPQAGYEVEPIYVDGGQGGLMMDASESVDEMRHKEQVIFPFLPLTEDQTQQVLALVQPTPLHTVRYFSPENGEVEETMIRSVSTMKYVGKGGTGNEYWKGFVLTLRVK